MARHHAYNGPKTGKTVRARNRQRLMTKDQAARHLQGLKRISAVFKGAELIR